MRAPALRSTSLFPLFFQRGPPLSVNSFVGTAWTSSISLPSSLFRPFSSSLYLFLLLALIVRGACVTKKRDKEREEWKITKPVGHTSKNMNRTDRGGCVGASLSWHLLPGINAKKKRSKEISRSFLPPYIIVAVTACTDNTLPLDIVSRDYQ